MKFFRRRKWRPLLRTKTIFKLNSTQFWKVWWLNCSLTTQMTQSCSWFPSYVKERESKIPQQVCLYARARFLQTLSRCNVTPCPPPYFREHVSRVISYIFSPESRVQFCTVGMPVRMLSFPSVFWFSIPIFLDTRSVYLTASNKQRERTTNSMSRSLLSLLTFRASASNRRFEEWNCSPSRRSAKCNEAQTQPAARNAK